MYLSRLWALAIEAHSYRRDFFPEFPKFGNSWTCVSKYRGVLSQVVEFVKSKKTGMLYFTFIWEIANIWKIQKLREKSMESMKKKASNKNDPNSQALHFRFLTASLPVADSPHRTTS